jgi:hypothetical protein
MGAIFDVEKAREVLRDASYRIDGDYGHSFELLKYGRVVHLYVVAPESEKREIKRVSMHEYSEQLDRNGKQISLSDHEFRRPNFVVHSVDYQLRSSRRYYDARLVFRVKIAGSRGFSLIDFLTGREETMRVDIVIREDGYTQTYFYDSFMNR